MLSIFVSPHIILTQRPE